MARIADAVLSGGYSLSLRGYSALDSYMAYPGLPFSWLETDADIPALAKLFDIRFPGADLAHCALDSGGGCCFFYCRDRDERPAETGYRPSSALLSLGQDWETRRFQDPRGVYPLLRELWKSRGTGAAEAREIAWQRALEPDLGSGRWRALMEEALILARYNPPLSRQGIEKLLSVLEDLAPGGDPGPEEQRVFLSAILVSPRPDQGLEFLKRAGFVEKFWPELAMLDRVDHSKEFHPEGNVWKHTLETFRHRKASGKAQDLRLSLGLLLHDIGKPLALSRGARRFSGHAELGVRTARNFLHRLDFDRTLIDDISYLVKNHKLPAALPRLPLARTGEVMESPLFPTLMELYRCDESSSFKGLEGYYQSSAAYRAYRRRSGTRY
jgi:poly(A) polymerase